jgi:phenylacetate-CoA ligase
VVLDTLDRPPDPNGRCGREAYRRALSHTMYSVAATRKGFPSAPQSSGPKFADGRWDAVETASRDRLVELQAKRLRWQVKRCFASSSLYRRKLEAAGAEPGDIRSPDDVIRLPVVTKEELRDDQAASPPFGSIAVAPESDWREVHPSTGTTGQPVNTIWTAADVLTITDFTVRTLVQAGVRPGDVLQNAFAYGLWVAGMSCHYAAARLGCLVVPTGASVSSDKQIEFLLAAGSTALCATPSYAIHIGEVLAARGISAGELSLRVGLFGGEPGAENPATRAAIESALGLSAHDYYGLAEVGPTFASECQAKEGLHFAEDHVLVEALDPGTRKPVAEGETGVLVFTHLTREGTPMIRYWSNDYARLSREPCACGRTHMRALGGIVGRHDDLIIFKGTKFYLSQVEKVIRSLAGLSSEFRIEIERRDEEGVVSACTVVAEHLGQPNATVHEDLRRALRAELGVGIGVRLEALGSLERTTFKAKRIVETPSRRHAP